VVIGIVVLALIYYFLIRTPAVASTTPAVSTIPTVPTIQTGGHRITLDNIKNFLL
jgi:hypothetical protein